MGHAPRILTVLAVFALGIALGAASVRYYGKPARGSGDGVVETRSSGFRFIKPLVECESTNKTELKSFREEVDTVVKQVVGAGYASYVSVYFRDLNNGPWFSINPEDDFIPASLLKVPTMISALHIAERDPAFLKRKEVIPANFPIDQSVKLQNHEPLTPGASYSVDELLYRMIVYSDNSAALMLSSLLPKGVEQDTYRELGVGFHEVKGKEDWLSVETYSSFFRVLFNATYLNREMSEKAMALLANSDLPQGMPDLAPTGVAVARKFGHSKVAGSVGVEQLHLCGIVYYPGNPYLVCVMARGEDGKNLSSAIGEVTEEIFKHVDRQRDIVFADTKVRKIK